MHRLQFTLNNLELSYFHFEYLSRMPETDGQLEMIETDATPITIPIKDIETRKLQDQSPMPPGLVKTPEELRALLAFLVHTAMTAAMARGCRPLAS